MLRGQQGLEVDGGLPFGFKLGAHVLVIIRNDRQNHSNKETTIQLGSAFRVRPGSGRAELLLCFLEPASVIPVVEAPAFSLYTLTRLTPRPQTPKWNYGYALNPTRKVEIS